MFSYGLTDCLGIVKIDADGIDRLPVSVCEVIGELVWYTRSLATPLTF